MLKFLNPEKRLSAFNFLIRLSGDLLKGKLNTLQDLCFELIEPLTLNYCMSAKLKEILTQDVMEFGEQVF